MQSVGAGMMGRDDTRTAGAPQSAGSSPRLPRIEGPIAVRAIGSQRRTGRRFATRSVAGGPPVVETLAATVCRQSVSRASLGSQACPARVRRGFFWRSSRNREALEVARIRRETLDPVPRDEDRVRMPEPCESREVNARLNREDHTGLDDRIVPDVEER